MDEFGEVMTVDRVWRYLNGAQPKNGSAFGERAVRKLMKDGEIRSAVKDGVLITRRRYVEEFLDRAFAVGVESLSLIPVPEPQKTFAPRVFGSFRA